MPSLTLVPHTASRQSKKCYNTQAATKLHKYSRTDMNNFNVSFFVFVHLVLLFVIVTDVYVHFC